MKTKLGRDFYFIQSAIICGYFATWIISYGTSWWALQERGSAVYLAAIVGISGLVEIYLSPALAAVVERLNCKKVFLGSFAAEAIAAVSLLFHSLYGSFNLFFVMTCVFMAAAASAARDVAGNGLLPSLVPEGEVTNAVSTRQAMGTLSWTLGPLTGGITFAAFGATAVFSIATMVFLFSLVLIHFSRLPNFIAPDSEHQDWFATTKTGFKVFFKVKTEFYLGLIFLVANLLLLPMFSVLVPKLVQAELSMPAWYAGIIDAMYGIGVLLTNLFLMDYLNRTIGKYWTSFIGLCAIPVMLVSLSFLGSLYAIPVIMGLIGAATVLLSVNCSSLRLVATPSVFRTRVSANAVFLSLCLLPVGNFLMGYLVEWLGATRTLFAIGMAFVLIPLLFISIPHLRFLMGLEEKAQKDMYAKLYPLAF